MDRTGDAAAAAGLHLALARDADARRRIVQMAGEFRPYDRYGPPRAGFSWRNLSWDAGTKAGCFLLKWEAGAKSEPHVHERGEEFLILEGGLVDSDGKRFQAGDYIVYDPGTHHFSTAPEGGCLMLVFLRGPNRFDPA
ncbi:cupin domain-containing protein [Zavarzinia sp. CC-PAN008]|uniref:cupin domain-containing protein n=1 Tax=Zavarzinia sp. CC-PAN008 TaxID=3243332 RepID=UPI003F74851C